MAKKNEKGHKADNTSEEIAELEQIESDAKSSLKSVSSKSGKKYNYVLQNKSIRRHSKHRTIVTVMTIVMASILLLGGATYGVLSLVEYNNFRIVVDQTGSRYLSLSPSPEFAQASEVLALHGPDKMDNICYLKDIEPNLEKIRAHEGTFTSEDSKYLASTFYLKNVSDEDRYYVETVDINNVTKNMDSAIRLMIISPINEYRVYAQLDNEGNQEMVCPYHHIDNPNDPSDTETWMAEPFASDTRVFQNDSLLLKKGEVKKYTFIIWLEGDDPECVNDILGGTMDLEITFRIK